MKKVTVITHSKFWLSGAGFWIRTRELLYFLGKHTDLTVFYLEVILDEDVAIINREFPFLKFVNLNKKLKIRTIDLANLYKEFIAKNGAADVYIIDKTENSYMLWGLDKAGRKFVDTHDLMSQRTKSARQHNAFSGIEISEEKEKALLHFYDKVICIQEDDYRLVSDWLGEDKVILAPHPVQEKQQIIRENVENISFIASNWPANVDGLKWFLNEIWPGVYQGGSLRLNVYGKVCQSFTNTVKAGVVFHGFADDLSAAYSQSDITINPVRWGAGLKIKTVEAMAHGLPIVLSAEGGRGLESLAGKAFMVAKDAGDFRDCLIDLIGNYDLRKSMGNEGYNFSQQSLSPEACFGKLLQAINN